MPPSARVVTSNDEEKTIKYKLRSLGVDILGPRSDWEHEIAESLHAFSSFVLFDEVVKCQSIIESYLTSEDGHCGGVGVLQGGSEHASIYRLQIKDDDDDEDGHDNRGSIAAAAELLLAFHSSPFGSRYRRKLTVAKVQQYMLNMCERWKQNRPPGSPESYREYTGLGNLMFILAFGEVSGQYRHIDNIDPNNQICCYMSEKCPSTIIYELGGPDIVCGEDLLLFWEDAFDDDAVPNLVREILASKSDDRLDAPFRQSYIPPRLAAWGSINATLSRFGKLYKPVKRSLSLSTDPGTTLVAGGNEVHAGPPTTGPRMFVFAVGIPEGGDEVNAFDLSCNSDDERSNEEDSVNKSGDGEVQYCPALLHMDVCTILFAMMHHEFTDRDISEHTDSKRFLLRVLVDFISENPKETYAQNLVDNKRRALWEWVQQLCERIELDSIYDDLLEEASKCDSIICGEIQARGVRKRSKGRRHTTSKYKK